MSEALIAPLRAGLDALGLVLDEERQRQLLAFLGLLQQWNRVYNLTAVRDPGEMLTHHVLDSLAAVEPLRRHLAGLASPAPRLLDVGSGGGLPAVVFAIGLPQLTVTCVDAVAKKTAFIRQVAGALRLENLHASHSRVQALSGHFEVVSSRAFASLPDFTGWTRHLLASEGVWLAMKGKRPDDEIAALAPDVAVFHVEPVQVPQLDAERCIVWMRPAPRIH